MFETTGGPTLDLIRRGGDVAHGAAGGFDRETDPSAPPVVRLAVVDDNTWYREGLGREGGLPPHHRVVARAADADELLPLLGDLPEKRCDVILLDLRIVRGLAPDPVYGAHPITSNPEAAVTQGVPAIRLLLSAAQREVSLGNLAALPAVLVYTQENAPRVHLSCLVAGVFGVVHKDDSLDRLAGAIDVVASGGCVVSPEVATLIGLMADQRKIDISESQAQVLALAGHGYPRERIAATLCIGISTVDKHLAAVRSACGDRLNTTDLADAFGLRDLAPPEPRNGAKAMLRRRIYDLRHRLPPRQ